MSKKGKPLHANFEPSRAAEIAFNRALKKVARHSGHLVEMHVGNLARVSTPVEMAVMMRSLEHYSEVLTPWAARQSAKLLEQVSKKNRSAYTKKSKAIGRELNKGFAQHNVAETGAALMAEQIVLIKSIPLEAGQRAQALAREAVTSGSRADDIAKELMATTSVTESRATLIARTETARATASFNQARAVAVGSTQYAWRNSGDESVRHSHEYYNGKRLDGVIFDWAHPPTLEDGTTGHPGTFPNCRCYAEPYFADET